MRRMRPPTARLVLTSFVVAAALAFAGVCALWARSYGTGERPDHWLLIRPEPVASWVVLSVPGQVIVARAPRGVLRNFGGDLDTTWEVAGLRYAAIPRIQTRVLWIPHWLLALAAGAWPAVSAALFVRRRRRLRRLALVGRCHRCGYDLRATPDPAGPRLPACPECGAAAGAAAEG